MVERKWGKGEVRGLRKGAIVSSSSQELVNNADNESYCQ